LAASSPSQPIAQDVSFYVALWKRPGISRVQFDDYWRNVHGPVCARLPGQHEYWQYHLADLEGGFFPAIEGVEMVSHGPDQFHGIAELTFINPEQRQVWFQASTILMDDEHNIFSKAIGYTTSPGNSRTLVDRYPSNTPNGQFPGLRYHVMLQKRSEVSRDEFRDYLTNSVFPSLAKIAEVSRLRFHLFDDLDLSRPDAQGVVHSEPLETQFHGAFEIAFPSAMHREIALASSEYTEAMAQIGRYVSIFKPFPEANSYTFVYDDAMTMAGMRGSSTAQLIEDLGATNQLRDDIRQLILKGS
jgi:hypothetical protein